MDTFIDQYFEPDEIRQRLARIRAQQSTVADLLGISDAGFSSFLTGRRGLSGKAQDKLVRVVHFLEDKYREAPIPPDLNNLEIIRPLWQAHQRRCDEAQVLRLADEIRSRNEQEKPDDIHA